MRLRDNPVYRLELRRWRSILAPGSVQRRLAIAGVAVLLSATAFAYSFPAPYHRAWVKVGYVTGFLSFPKYYIPGFRPVGGGLHRLPDLSTIPLQDLYFPGNLLATLAPPLLVGRYMSRIHRQGITGQMTLTRLRGSDVAEGAVWGRLVPVIPLALVCYGYFGVSAFLPIGPFFNLHGPPEPEIVRLLYTSDGLTRAALCTQAVACGYVAVAVSARTARTMFSLPLSLVLCAVCIPAAAYSFGTGVAYWVWGWLSEHGLWTAPFLQAAWRCELLKIALILVFYLILWLLAKGAATLEIERLMGTRRTRWRL